MADEGVYYGDYLKLSQLLSAQQPESARRGAEAHDELLFVIVHQAYELWFKQILHELDRIQADFAETPMRDATLGRIVHGLDRIQAILTLVTGQIDLLETMTPLDFLDFRDMLRPASGFQSLQFRMIETQLGLPREARLTFGGKSHEMRLSPEDRDRLEKAESGPTLAGQLGVWLARTPFVAAGDYAFDRAYRDAVTAMIDRDIARLAALEGLPEERRAAEIAALQNAKTAFAAIFDPSQTADWRLPARAIQAALFITLYRDEPVLQIPFRLIARLMDIDEAMTMWRYRHAVMVERMIGVKTGTGGSSGHGYLRGTAEKHRVFTDLFRLSTYLIPRSAIPALPDAVRRRMAFVYASETGAGGA